MDVCWRFYRFDYVRYLALRPLIRSATVPGVFAALAETPEAEAVVEALEEESMSVEEARSAFVCATCCAGDALSFDSGLLHSVSELAHLPQTEEAAELLGQLLTGHKKQEDWLDDSSGLVGFLTPDETRALRDSYFAPRPTRRGTQPHVWGRRKRRGGLLGACVGFFRRLLDREPPREEMMRLLGELIEEAVQQHEGLVVVTA